MFDTIFSMVDKISITLPEQTLALVRERASHENVSVSAWLAQAAEHEAMRAMFSEHARVMRDVGQKQQTLVDRFEAAETARAEWRRAQRAE